MQPLTKFIRAYQYPILLFLVIRIWTLAWASWSLAWRHVDIQAYENFYYGAPPLDTTPLGWLWAPWQRWDSIWYVRIAEFGYAPDNFTTAFFPLYPLLIRAVITLVPINGIAAGLVVSTIAGCGAFVLFYHLVRGEFGEVVARRALLYLATFPTAFFLFAVYTEAVFLLFVLAAWLCARHKRWVYAGIFGGLAALTRAQGFLLAVPLTWIFIEQYRRREISFRSIWTLCPLIGTAAIFFFYLFQISGSVLAWLEIESLWHRFALPWEPIGRSLTILLTNGDLALRFINLNDVGWALLFGVCGIYFAWRKQIAEALYLAIILLPSLFGVTLLNENLPLASMTRYLVVAFPAFTLFGRIRLRAPLPALFALISFLCQMLILFAFVQWWFVE